MKSKINNIFIATLLVILSVVAGVLIFSKLWNLFQTYPDIKFNAIPIYLYILFIVISSIILFLILKNISKLNVQLNNEKKELIDLLNINKKKEEKIEEDKDKTDILNLVYELIPDDSLLSEPQKYCETCLTKISKKFEIVQGIVYLLGMNETYYPIATYAYYSNNPPSEFKLGETIPGQVAKDKKILNLKNMPDNYVTVVSGLGQGAPRTLFFLPIVADNKTIAIFELASFKNFDIKTEETFYKFAEIINEKIKSIINK